MKPARQRARRGRERHRRADCGRLERRPVVEQKGFQRLAELLDEVKPANNLHRLGDPLANPVGDRRILRQPGSEGRG
jgi:hypothetical protein